MLTLAEDSSDYPTEDEIGLGSNPKINDLIDNGILRHLSKVDASDFGDDYLYDNDGDGEIQIIVRNSTNKTISDELERIFKNRFVQRSYLDSVYYDLNLR